MARSYDTEAGLEDGVRAPRDLRHLQAARNLKTPAAVGVLRSRDANR